MMILNICVYAFGQVCMKKKNAYDKQREEKDCIIKSYKSQTREIRGIILMPYYFLLSKK